MNAAVIVARPWSDLSPQIKAFMLVAVACQLLLAVVALVVWWRTPADLMPSPGRAVWAAVIVMVQIGGPILFLALRAAAARRAREASRCRRTRCARCSAPTARGRRRR